MINAGTWNFEFVKPIGLLKSMLIKSEGDQTLAGKTDFINEKELMARLPMSRRTLFAWRTSGKIPCVRLGGRRILFHWPSVEAALLRYQRGGNS
jgi:hypothetical protein